MRAGAVLFTVALTSLSGWVDAIAFVDWHRLFVSFMSGNTTSLGVMLSSGAWAEAARLVHVLLAFVAGVVVGQLLGMSGTNGSRSRVLLLVAALIAAAAAVSLRTSNAFGPLLLALAMGVQSAGVYRVGCRTLPVTYVTGTLVNLGRGIADALTGDAELGAVLEYGLSWAGLLVGAMVGGSVAARSRLVALLIAAGWAGGLAMLARVLPTSPAGTSHRQDTP